MSKHLENIVEIFTENTTLAQTIVDWLQVEHNLVDEVDYNMWIKGVDRNRSIIFKFYDNTNDSVGNTPTGFPILFALKWT